MSRPGRIMFAAAGVSMFAAAVLQPAAPAAAESRMHPELLFLWKTFYPASTLPARMAAITGEQCSLCHQPPSQSLDGNCYRNHFRALLNDGFTPEDAIQILDGLDSDGDGVLNGVEINWPRQDLPGEVGYNPGLIGPEGLDLCSKEPTVVTGQPETPTGPAPCLANCDGSTLAPVLNVNDFICFQNLFAAGDLRANCDRTTTIPPVLNVVDFICFLNKYAAGCPAP